MEKCTKGRIIRTAEWKEWSMIFGLFRGEWDDSEVLANRPDGKKQNYVLTLLNSHDWMEVLQ